MDGWTCHNGPHTLTQALNPVRVHICLAPYHAAGSLRGDLGRVDTAGQRMQRGGEMEETAPCNLACVNLQPSPSFLYVSAGKVQLECNAPRSSVFGSLLCGGSIWAAP